MLPPPAVHRQDQPTEGGNMARIVVTEFVSLDGVMEDPGSSESFEHGGWSFEISRGEEGDRFKLEETMASEALLLGRRTYEGFAAAWPSRSSSTRGRPCTARRPSATEPRRTRGRIGGTWGTSTSRPPIGRPACSP